MYYDSIKVSSQRVQRLESAPRLSNRPLRPESHSVTSDHAFQTAHGFSASQHPWLTNVALRFWGSKGFKASLEKVLFNALCVEDDRCAEVSDRLPVDRSIGCLDGSGVVCLATFLEEGTAAEAALIAN
jgi:hypothetical protein